MDDSELMLLAFNTYEAFGTLLDSPVDKAAKLTAMHMAVVIASIARPRTASEASSYYV